MILSALTMATRRPKHMSYTQKAAEFLSTREAADLLRVTERSILNFRQRGRLPFMKMDSGAVRFRREHVLALMEAQPTVAPAKSWQATRWTSDYSKELPASITRAPIRRAAS
jgi:excisionase family DNA binding protein